MKTFTQLKMIAPSVSDRLFYEEKAFYILKRISRNK